MARPNWRKMVPRAMPTSAAASATSRRAWCWGTISPKTRLVASGGTSAAKPTATASTTMRTASGPVPRPANRTSERTVERAVRKRSDELDHVIAKARSRLGVHRHPLAGGHVSEVVAAPPGEQCDRTAVECETR